MPAWLMAFAGFALYLLYDIDSFKALWKPLRSGFAVGTLLIAAATAMQLYAALREKAFCGWWDILLLLLGVLALAALIYCLFFALPFDATYKNPEQGRRTYTFGIYALCRHPGILCFFAMYLFWGIASLPTKFLLFGMVISVLNLGYAYFQDRVTFPKTFCDYADYREKVPFLIPTAVSIRRAVKTWGYSYEKEEVL